MHNLFPFLPVSQMKIAAPGDNWKISFAFSSVIYKSSGFGGLLFFRWENSVEIPLLCIPSLQSLLDRDTCPPNTMKIYSKWWLISTAYTVCGSLSQPESWFIHSNTASSILLSLWSAGISEICLPFIQEELLIALIGNRCRYKNLLLSDRIDLKNTGLPRQQRKTTPKNTK